MQPTASVSLLRPPDDESNERPSAPAMSNQFDPLRQRAHMDRVEHDLLQEIQRIQTKLGEIRHHQSRARGHRNSHVSHNSLNHQHSYPSSSRRFANNFSVDSNQSLATRVLSVSLRLPRNDHRISARQQLFNSAIPPKAALSLPDAVKVPFVWVGSDTPGMRSDPDHVIMPISLQQRQRRLRRRRRLRDEVNMSTPQSGSAKHDVNDDDDDDDDDDDNDDCAWEDTQPYHASHHNVHVTLPEDPVVLQRFQSFCEDVLWRLLHYDYIAVDNPDLVVYWSAYKEVNQRFAESVAETCEDGDIIWVHNYHLMLLPALLRDLVPHARIGFFLYTPFPSAELFRILPYRLEILRGVVAADVIGFHSYGHAKQFVTSARRLLRLDATPNKLVDPMSGRTCKIGIYPSGIDADTLRSHVTSKVVKSRVAELRGRFEGVKVVVGVDRLDDCFAGLLHKLLAFERLLDDNPNLVGKVVLVQAAMLPKHPRNLTTYREQRIQLNKCVARINSFYGSWSYSPIHFINTPLDPTELHALMCVGHALVVTTVRDGMGLVPHEWTVCQHGAYNGPIVLSEFSSAAHSFATALHVNPWDIDAVAAKIKVALDMGDASRHMRNEAAYRFVTTHTAQQWGTTFLDDIESVQRPSFPRFYNHRKHRHHQRHQINPQGQNHVTQNQQSQQQQSHAGSSSILSFSNADPTTMKPTLNTEALVHAYRGTLNSMPSPPPPPPPPPSLSLSAGPPHVLSSSPPFAYGEHISRIMRGSLHSNQSTTSPHGTSKFPIPTGTLTSTNSSSNNNSRVKSNAVQISPSHRSFDSSTTDSNEMLAMQSSSSLFGNGPVPMTHRRSDDMPRGSNYGLSPGLILSLSETASTMTVKRPRVCLFIVDLEGTLIPSAIDKREVPLSAIDMIQALVDASPQNYVLVTSSHGRDVLLRSFGDMRVYLSAEDGAFFRSPGSPSWSLLFRDSSMSGGSGAGKRVSPGNTVHDGDQYTPGGKPPSSIDEETNTEQKAAPAAASPSSVSLCAAVNEKIGAPIERKDGEALMKDNCISSGSGITDGEEPTIPPKSNTMVSSTSPQLQPLTSTTNSVTQPTGTGPGTVTSKASMSSHTSFSSVELGQGDGGVTLSWKESVMHVLHHCAERTPGAVVHEAETMATWEYGDADADNGYWQSRQVQKHLESLILRGVNIGVECEEGPVRKWIRVRPADVDKAKAALRFFKSVISSYGPSMLDEKHRDKDSDMGKEKEKGSNDSLASSKNNVRFDLIVCFGDDRADETMFELLHDRMRLENAGIVCSPNSIFTCKVGIPVARTAAASCLDGPDKVMQVLRRICGKHAWSLF